MFSSPRKDIIKKMIQFRILKIISFYTQKVYGLKVTIFKGIPDNAQRNNFLFYCFHNLTKKNYIKDEMLNIHKQCFTTVTHTETLFQNNFNLKHKSFH